MEEQQYLVYFRVSDLNEIRTLVAQWQSSVENIDAQGPEQTIPVSFPHSYEPIEIEVEEEQGRGQDVFLVFWAPMPMIDQFFKNLCPKGLNFTQEFDTETPALPCRIISTATEP